MANSCGSAPPPGMRPLWRFLLVVLCLLLGANLVQAQACPSIVTRAKARTTRKYAVIQMAVILPKGSPYVNDAAVKVSLPQGLSPVVSTRISASQKGASRTIDSYADGLNVYFTGLRLRKSIKIIIKAKLSGCTLPSTLTFSTLFYQQDGQGQVVCPVSGTVNAPVKYRRNSKAVHATSGCTTPSPTLPPSTAPFVPYGVGQRCLQAGRLAPWTRRQLGGNTGRSLLETINSPEQCFSYCGIYGGTPAPYYFNWKTTTNQCFCCGGECTLVFDPDYTAYVAQTTATAAPTPFFNTTGSRRRLMAEDANVVMLEAKEQARNSADERFRRGLLSFDIEDKARASTFAQGQVRNVGSEVSDNSKIAIVTFLSEAPENAYNPLADYETIFPITSASLKRYADRHGYKLIIHREPFNEQKQAYWEKMRIIREALDAGFEWVLYTDIDVLILDYDRPLQEFMVDRTIITVNEWNPSGPSQTPRSGFLLVRNVPRAYEFLDVWSRSFEFYKDIENPEQSSLDTMYETATWRGDFFLHDWSDFHAYDYVHYGLKSFSMHFPGKLKVYRVAKTWVYLNTVDGQRFDADSEEGTLTEYAARLLREHLAHYSEPAIRAGLKPHAGDNEDVEQCLRKAAAAGYAGVDLTYDEAFHAYTELYMVLDLLTGVPTVVFITVPDKTAIPEPVQANIQSWRDLNPGFEVVVHDDRDLEFLVMLLVPRLQETWPSLLKVQQADIYRFLVTAFLGGVYADSDTVCKTPVADWLERPMGLILGVEAQNVDTAGSHRHEGDRTVVFAQYAFATGAFHPVLIRMLHRIMGGREELLGAASPLLTPNDRLRAVLGTTGPTAWTDVVAEYFCYAQSGVALTPDVFWRGGGAPAIEILPIAAFGAGQTHSGAPAADHPNVLIYHKFKGSVVLRGEKWMQATE